MALSPRVQLWYEKENRSSSSIFLTPPQQFEAGLSAQVLIIMVGLKRIIWLVVALTTDAYTYGSYDEDLAKDVMVFAGASYWCVSSVSLGRCQQHGRPCVMR